MIGKIQKFTKLGSVFYFIENLNKKTPKTQTCLKIEHEFNKNLDKNNIYLKLIRR